MHSAQHVLFNRGAKDKREIEAIWEKDTEVQYMWCIIEVESGIHTTLSGISGDCIWSRELTVTWEVMETLLAQSFVVSARCEAVTAHMTGKRHPHSGHKEHWISQPGTRPKAKRSPTKSLFGDARGSHELASEERMPGFQRQRCQRSCGSYVTSSPARLLA